MKKFILITTVFGLFLIVSIAMAATGALLGTVDLPGNGDCSVAGTFTGTYYMTVQECSGINSNQLQIYLPPAGGNGAATLIATKNVVDSGGDSVNISALAWDPGRGKLWAAHDDKIWLIDIGDPTVSGNSVATYQFQAGVGGIDLIDGLAYDGIDDSLYYSPDISCYVYHFDVHGNLLNTVTPLNADEEMDCAVSGVAVGTNNTLYIGRDGYAEIRRIDKTTGAFVSQFATTAGRVEDLTCDPVTYAPLEAILAKDAYNGLYEAFEVEAGTCPLPKIEVPVDIKPMSCPNPLNIIKKGALPVAILGTEEFDVSQIDPVSITLEGVSPLRWAMEDEAASFEPYLGKEDAFDCNEAGPDGYMDLGLKFVAQELVAALGEVSDGDVIVLHLEGYLMEEFGGTPIVGEDVVWILNK
jgi:hypothetical protein